MNYGKLVCFMRSFSTSALRSQAKHYKLAVVGGGAGGCSIATKFAGKFGKGQVVVIEPSSYHYYQPMWTFVGAGIEKVEDSARPMSSVLPKDADWIKSDAIAFDPETCTIACSNGDEIKYDYLVVAIGMQLDYHKIKGLPEAMKHDPAVCSNYTFEYCTKTFPSLQKFEEGNAIFTFPCAPVKCGGSAQAIMYLADQYLRKTKKRDRANIILNTTATALFAIPKYCEVLSKIVSERDIIVNHQRNLVEIRSETKEAVFCNHDCDVETMEILPYSFIHVVPPMSTPDALSNSVLVDHTGFLDVDKYTLQHLRYPNIFGLGDCTNLPTSKTAAAVACQSGVLRRNLTSVMEGGNVAQKRYSGYTSCPVVIEQGKCMMTEFDFDGSPLETFPINQANPSRLMYHLKKDIMPFLYWEMLLNLRARGEDSARSADGWMVGYLLTDLMKLVGKVAPTTVFPLPFPRAAVGSSTHFYQPMWTFVGGGVKTVEHSARPMSSVIPKKADWIKAKALNFDPDNSTVTCNNGDVIKYDYLVVAMGIQLDFHKVKGLTEAMESDPTVCSNYSNNYVTKTFPAMQNFTEGNAIFTLPNTPIKCGGAAQKIMYLAEEYFRKTQKRDKANIIFNTSSGALFGIKKYADSLIKIVDERDIDVNYKMDLQEVRPERKEAVFRKLDSDSGETQTFKYSFMHVVPPMSAPDILKESPLADDSGYMDVNKYTLQHTRYPNVFGLGDCTNIPTSKTAAAVAAQSGVLKKNLAAVMEGKSASQKLYDGYTSCPVVTGYGKCMMAEFDFDGNPLETFPMDQSKERRLMYHMKRDIMPELYWNLLVKGLWDGPEVYRKLMRLGMNIAIKPSTVDI